MTGRSYLTLALLVFCIGVRVAAGVPVRITSPTSDDSCVVNHLYVDLAGTASAGGLMFTPVGNQVISADLSAATGLSSGDTVSVNVTQCATYACLPSRDFGFDDTVCIGSSVQFTLNGRFYSFSPADTVSNVAAAVNADSDLTGVLAQLSGTGCIVFVSRNLGSDAMVVVTAAEGILPGNATSATAHGLDAHAYVTHCGGSGGLVSDASWISGTGATLRDSLGNTIVLTDAAATAAGDLGPVIQVSTDDRLIYVPTGSQIMSADLSEAPNLHDGDVVQVAVTQCATHAVLPTKDFGANDESTMGGSGSFILAGNRGSKRFQFQPVDTVATLCAAINLATQVTGVVAISNGTGIAILRSVDIGGNATVACVTESGMSLLMAGAPSMSAVGTDMRATVTVLGGNVSDALWQGGGTTLHDSLGNTIVLTQAAAESFGALASTVEVHAGGGPYVRWTNETTRQTGPCTGGLNWTAQHIPLAPGTNIVRVSSAGCDTPDELSVTVQPEFTSLGPVKQLPDNTPFSASGLVVTVPSGDMYGSYRRVYVESQDRSCGIWLESTTALKGNILWLDGTISTVDGERRLSAQTVAVLGNATIKPLAMNNRAICSALATGPLVATWGRIESRTSSQIVIDDGSGKHIRCPLPLGTYVNPAWTRVRVTGIASVDETDHATRVVQVCDPNSVQGF